MSAPSTGGASRDGYGSGLLRIAEDPRVVVIEADLGKSTKSCHFRTKYPSKSFSMGIAEQTWTYSAYLWQSWRNPHWNGR